MRSVPLKGSFRLGFDGCGRVTEGGFAVQSDGYPPYNLERWPSANDGAEMLRLVFAVAGFASDQLDVSVTERHLLIRGEQKTEGECRHFLHRGIAARRFQRAFLLADGLEVVSADLCDGLLSIDISRRESDTITRTIRIEARDATCGSRTAGPDGPHS